MAGDDGSADNSADSSAGRARRIDFGITMLFGGLYAGALFLVVTGFTVEPSGCGGRFQASCAGETCWRLGIGFGLLLVVAPGLHRVVPSVPFEQGVGRVTGVVALLVGALAGVALTVMVSGLAGRAVDGRADRGPDVAGPGLLRLRSGPLPVKPWRLRRRTRWARLPDGPPRP
ncbi:hypothetical protein [Streptomyces sp. NPDC058867]|uniref:hypothetical protein n=1 Tax=unclassified Streptomyces TaxID=2593676 RepID=UPI00368F3EB9